MTEISVMALILILCITTLGVLDQYSVQMGFYSPLFSGTLTGLVLGDIQTGLVVGATLQLMSLGIAHYGGATIPDYFSASIMGTAYAIISGNGAEYGIGLAIPIALLLTQLDILARMSHSICKHYMDRYIETLDYRKFTIAHVIGGGTWILSRVFPVFIGLVFGEAVVSAINAVIPDWIMSGLQAAGKILPAMGIAILLKYLPLKKYLAYFLLGFVMLAYGDSIFTILAVAIIGTAWALIHYQSITSVKAAPAAVSGDDEEVEIDE